MARQLTAVLYVRVSYRKQVEGTSLETQEKTCREWCAARGYEVAAVFTDAGESAKTADRPEFQRMLAYVRKNSAKVGHIVVYRFDRFARNLRDDLNVREMLEGLKVQLHSTQEMVDTTPFGEAARVMAALFAQTDNSVRAERAVAGMKARVADGRWCWKAPLGYVCTGRRGKDVSLKPDATAPLVTELFELIGSGHHRPHDALAQMTARGLRSQRGKAISLGTLLQMLRSPVYCGRLEIPAWGVSKDGDWQPIVSVETFARTQLVLDGKAVETTTPTPRADDRFPLRQFVRCALCDKPLTASVSRGHGGQYPYYHCMKRDHVRVRAEKLESEWVEMLERMQPKAGMESAVLAVLRKAWEAMNTSSETAAAVTAIKSSLVELERQKANLLHAVQIGTLDGEDFAVPYRKVKEEIQAAQEQLMLATAADVDVEAALDFMQHVYWNLHFAWQTKDLATKQAIQRAVSPSGLKYHPQTGLEPAISDFYTIIYEGAEGREDEMVRPEGFEPPAY